MKSLLIYNNNVATSLATKFEGENYLFQIGKAELLNPNFSIDSKIHSILSSEIVTEKYDAIFIPFSLSEDNYIEFIGLRFAFHIRLTKEFRNIQTPIIFYGAENATEVNKLSGLGSILFSKNVYTTDKVSVEHFKKEIEWVKENYTEISETDLLNDFISRNVIKPSGNYATHHSITNEWCIYRWTKALKIEDDAIKQIENIISSNLYFKYLKAKYPISELSDNQYNCPLEDGKVLFIDDELEKGWATIFRKIRYPKLVECFGSDFKNLTANEIIQKSIEKVKSINPEVVILDFRLHDDDFEITNPENVTGYKILKQIKEYNQGIQVIILSATNKIWNLLELQKIGADYFILKESPELSQEDEFTKNAIIGLKNNITEALKRSYLKDLYEQTRVIKNTKLNDTKSFIEEKKTIKQNLNSAFSLTNLAKNNDTLEYALFNYIQILEIYCNLFTFKNKEKAIVYKNYDDIKGRKNEKVIFEKVGDKIFSKYKYEKGYYPFQKTAEDKDKQFKNFLKEEIEYEKGELELSFALKLAAILDVQLGSLNKLPELMEIIFIRNNKIAHSGNFDKTKRNISEEDIKTVFQIIYRLIQNTF